MAHALTGVRVVFGLGLESGDLAAPTIVGFHWAFEALFAELAGVAVQRFGGVGLVVHATCGGVDGSRAGHDLARRATCCHGDELAAIG